MDEALGGLPVVVLGEHLGMVLGAPPGGAVVACLVLVVSGAGLGLLVGTVLGEVVDEALPVVGLGEVPGVGLGQHLGELEAGVPLLIPPEDAVLGEPLAEGADHLLV